MSKLFIVGAGPGDPDLITLKGLNALKMAEVVLYDALVAEELLQFARPDALKLYVGKRVGVHSFSQEEINDLVIGLCRQNDTVVRLKGGDPMVFGRGHEEAEFALAHGIEVEVVPGISSCLAGPTSEDIPLTKRGISDSFWVLTGNTMNNELSKDLIYAARSSATVVILMGLRKLDKIVQLFLQHRVPTEPICLIERSTTQSQKILQGSLRDIVSLNDANPVTTPALIVIGSVVNERNKIKDLRENLLHPQLVTNA